MNCQEMRLRNRLADYALGLLPASEAQRVEAHIAACAACRAAVLQERALAHEVRATVHAATRPSPERLRALMPPVPRRRTRQLWLWRPVAALALLAVLFLGSLQMSHSGSPYGLPTASTTALVATATRVPTAGWTETPQISALQPGAPATRTPVILPPAAPARPDNIP
jgi:anti-sigma factor RsiW